MAQKLIGEIFEVEAHTINYHIKEIKKAHVAKVLMCRDLDKEQSKMIAMI